MFYFSFSSFKMIRRRNEFIIIFIFMIYIRKKCWENFLLPYSWTNENWRWRLISFCIRNWNYQSRKGWELLFEYFEITKNCWNVLKIVQKLIKNISKNIKKLTPVQEQLKIVTKNFEKKLIDSHTSLIFIIFLTIKKFRFLARVIYSVDPRVK